MSEAMEAAPVSGAATETTPEPQELSLSEIIRQAAEGKTAEEITGGAQGDEGPARDASGRFASKGADDGGTEDAEVKADDPTPATEEPEAPAITPPQAWSAAEKEVFASLPREAQEAIRRRETDVERAFQERAPKLKEFEAIQEVLAPFAARYRTQGFTDVDAVRMWGTIAGELVRNPAATIAELMRQHGVTPEQITGQRPNPKNQPAPLDPTVAELKARLERFEQSQIEQAQQSIASRIEKFASDPKYPHFSDVRVQMGKLMAAGVVEDGDFEGAYDAAIRIVPSVREKVEAAENAAAEEKRIAAAKANAEKARKAPTVVRGAPPLSNGTTIPMGNGSVRDDINAAIAALQSR